MRVESHQPGNCRLMERVAISNATASDAVSTELAVTTETAATTSPVGLRRAAAIDVVPTTI